ncbi:MAG: 4'-phosphopantetheinyl transferase superfamily protein [Bacteroidetes bacterium]|nr:4'-phosphopantetheinyl transferase superfamily protein [Bacteroidota bacterium]MBI3482181.1 4'-phosphopantetheinyl transferase superfamily protein [Bacteroidota bacterium]
MKRIFLTKLDHKTQLPMPLREFHQHGPQSGRAVWHITENESQISSGIIGSVPEEIVNEKKRLEWLASRQLILTLCNHMGLRFFGIRKDGFGKPFLEKYPHHISLSHSFPFVAAQIDHDDPVGIDLEQPRNKLLNIAPRIMSPAELKDAGTDVIKHCVYWCAKETMFKIHGTGGLHFNNQLNVMPFHLQEEGTLIGVISESRKETRVELCYEVNPEFVLVYTRR